MGYDDETVRAMWRTEGAFRISQEQDTPRWTAGLLQALPVCH
jgi:hypothetical protein